MWQAITLRDLSWNWRDVTGKLAAIRAEGSDSLPPEGADLPGWGAPTDLVYDTGPCSLFSIQQTVGAQADWLVRAQADYLLSYPSNLLALARYFQDNETKLPGLRGVTSYGEVLGAEVRKACRAAWGVEVVDMYSTQEVGYIALQCPQSERYHVQSESLYVEILDDQGQACAPGEIGRVIVSTLHNYAMPLLRYEVGDFAEVGDSGCSCGRTLPVLTRILGRERNMLLLPDGAKTWPTFPAKAWAHLDAIRQLQIAQLAPDHVEARVVGPRPLTEDEESEFASMVQIRFGHSFRVTFAYVEQIQRSKSGKFEDFVCLVEGAG
jgi:phenylacetate-CoA ligase